MRPDLTDLYRRMLRSRLVEQAIAALWYDGRISGEMHLSIGEEAIGAGVIDHLDDGDALALDHRGTAPLVIRGVDPSAVIAECLGDETGLCGGAGGHMHMMSREYLAASSGIVGAAGPMACGFALAHQHLRPNRIAVAFFGEGAANQGMLLESLNLAACWKLPVVFVCKDNGMAISTPSPKVTGGDLLDRAGGFGVPASSVDGSDAEAVWDAAEPAVRRARRGRGPSFLLASCVRPDGHFLGDALVRIARHPIRGMSERAGPLTRAVTDRDGGSVFERAASLAVLTGAIGRSASSQVRRRRDPVRRLRGRLGLDRGRLRSLEGEVEAEVQAAVRRVVAEEASR
jgi:pyruvate dehydrogenase E1 component alpha subunit